MKNLKEKLRKNGGFTLVEMLIVVAIIAILIAVSIPMVGSALERAREATDQANERAAIGAAETKFLTSIGESATLADGSANPNYVTWATDADSGAKTATFYYKVENASGSLTQTKPTDSKGFDYGQGTSAGAVGEDRAGCYIFVEVTEDGVATADWGKVGTTG